jgi:carboxyl-terminal processing protease
MANWQKWMVAVFLMAMVATTTFAAGFGLGRYVTPAAARPSSPLPEATQKQFDVFWQAWQLVEREFYTEKPLDYQAMTYGAIRGMVDSLGDTHTMFLTRAEKDMLSEDLEGQFGGIGVTINLSQEGLLTAVKMIPGAPAERAGIKPGDVILEVDGRSIRGMDTVQAISLIRGPEGSSVRLLIQRGQETPFEVTVMRAMIALPVTESRMLDNGIAYLRLSEFNGKATVAVRAALTELLQQKPRGLVFDLRDNPGGYLHVADEIASEFLSNGLVVIERGRDGSENRHQVQPGGKATQIPLVVLVDGGSASASEIVAGAIQDQQRGVLIGEQTYGKGSVQLTERLSDDSGLQLTIRRWYTPNDHGIDGKGLTPDVVVKMTEQDLQSQTDPQLQQAVEYLLKQTAP